MSDRIKRIIAFLIDWNITLLPFAGIFFLISRSEQQSAISPATVIVYALLILIPFALFVLRDVIWKGRSLGKRIFGLRIYDKNTLHPASLKQRTLRNVFFFVYPVDGLILLTTGESIGDGTAKALVLSQKSYKQRALTHTYQPEAEPSHRRKANPREVILVIIFAIVLVLGSCGIVLLTLNAQKDTEEYKLAYQYLVSSDAFAELDAEESQIWMNQYSSHTRASAGSDSVTRTVEIGFRVKLRSFTVVLHMENNKWQVCKDCTFFR